MHINYDSCYLFPQHVVSIFGRAEELGLVQCSAARSQREECVSYCSDIIIHSCQIIQQLLRLLHVLPHTQQVLHPAYLFIFHVAVLLGCHADLPLPLFGHMNTYS